jgi:hypothetical protein
MTETNRIYSFALAGDVDDDRLLRATADLLAIDPSGVAMLMDDHAREVDARVEVHRHAQGLRTNLVVYAEAMEDERALACKLARILAQEVVVSLPAAWSPDPYWWLLVDPSGAWFLVEEVSDAGGSVALKPARTRLPIDRAGLPKSPW